MNVSANGSGGAPEAPRLISRPGPPANLIVRGVRLLDPRAGLDASRDLVVREGQIAELAEPGKAAEIEGAETVDGDGLLALPAFVDPHVHLRVPGQEHKEDLETGTRSAAAGGYCAVIAMANTSPPIDSAAVLGSVRERAEREASIPVGFMANVTREMAGMELTEMAELRDAGAIGFSDDGVPIANARVLRRALQYQRLADGLIALHEEDPDLSAGGVMHEGEVSAALGMAGVPSVSESTMIARDCSLALYEDTPIHVQHLSARVSVEEVARAKAAGVRITCEATPHHLTLTEEAVRSLDARFKMNPPLRSEDDRQALVEGLRDGTIDCIATDHAPHAAEEKEVPFEEAAWGVTGLETAFAALYTDLVLPGVLPLEVLVERMTCGGEPFGIEAPAPRGRRRGEHRPDRSRGHLDRRGGGLREPLLQQLLRRPPADGPRPDDGRRRPGRLPAALVRPGGRILSGRLEADRTTLIVVDVQEAFRKAIPDFERIAKATATLIEGAEAIGIPVVITEQYPKGLGETVPEVAEHLPEGVEPLEKVVFAASEAEGFDLEGRDQALVCGIETHVCVNQTALDLLASGVDVQVAVDAVGSRTEENKGVGLQKMERAGATLTSVETALFELLGRAGTDEFKQVQRLILDYAPNPGSEAKERVA